MEAFKNENKSVYIPGKPFSFWSWYLPFFQSTAGLRLIREMRNNGPYPTLLAHDVLEFRAVFLLTGCFIKARIQSFLLSYP